MAIQRPLEQMQRGQVGSSRRPVAGKLLGEFSLALQLFACGLADFQAFFGGDTLRMTFRFGVFRDGLHD